MELKLIVAIGVIVLLYYFAILRLVLTKCTWAYFQSRFALAMPFMGPLILLAAVSGFAVGGETGLIGNTLGAVIWTGLLFLMWVADWKPRPPRGERNSDQ